MDARGPRQNAPGNVHHVRPGMRNVHPPSTGHRLATSCGLWHRPTGARVEARATTGGLDARGPRPERPPEVAPDGSDARTSVRDSIPERSSPATLLRLKRDARTTVRPPPPSQGRAPPLDGQRTSEDSVPASASAHGSFRVRVARARGSAWNEGDRCRGGRTGGRRRRTSTTKPVAMSSRIVRACCGAGAPRRG